MTREQPAAVYVELPAEQLTGNTGSEFRLLLARVRAASGLSLGQLHAKTGISRSQVHSLCSPLRRRLPRNHDQVLSLITACRLAPAQAVEVMQLLSGLSSIERR